MIEERRFRTALLRWYDAQRRELPWRKDDDPYRVWVSEIMLQQTRVAAVLEHYARFLVRFPSVQALARAREATVLAAWSGLGYYRRARMLHAAAREVVKERGGQFPADAAGWQSLPGVGRYTAAALASICCGQPCAVVDGNVERVLERLHGERPRDPWKAAQALLSRTRPGDFNQAMMELGATVCVPQMPVCAACPVARWCRAAHRVLPVARKKPRAKKCVRLALAADGHRVLLVQRASSRTVMPGMWELPPADDVRGEAEFTVRHAIMNTDYWAEVVRMSDPVSNFPANAQWVSARRAERMPLSGLARKILRRAGIINR